MKGKKEAERSESRESWKSWQWGKSRRVIPGHIWRKINRQMITALEQTTIKDEKHENRVNERNNGVGSVQPVTKRTNV